MMDSKIADDERKSFSGRLIAALRDNAQSTQSSQFCREFNLRADGAAVTVHGARKWLHGESIPTQEKILILARWLNVNPAWLRFGDAENSQYIIHADDVPGLDSQQLMLIHDIMSLPPAAQLIMRDLVDSFLRHDGMQTARRLDRQHGHSS